MEQKADEPGEEELPYYDSFGFYRGKAKRDYIHNTGLWHKGVHVWLFNSEGKIFLKKRASNKKIYPEQWEDVGEHLKPNESFKQAALRGLKEELGVDERQIKSLKKVMETKMCHPKSNCELVELWYCFYDGPIKENEESFSGRFFSREEINEMLKNRKQVTPWFKELFYWCMKVHKWPKKQGKK